jgi:hypothetical protein
MVAPMSDQHSSWFVVMHDDSRRVFSTLSALNTYLRHEDKLVLWIIGWDSP